jgi:hypothetical protein
MRFHIVDSLQVPIKPKANPPSAVLDAVLAADVGYFIQWQLLLQMLQLVLAMP